MKVIFKCPESEFNASGALRRIYNNASPPLPALFTAGGAPSEKNKSREKKRLAEYIADIEKLEKRPDLAKTGVAYAGESEPD